jgi:predicted RNA binding protein YcfA (HicA-like mRNA interferase family)
MKSVSGKDFAKALERHGWSLLRVQGSITFMVRPEAIFAFPCPFTEINHSKLVCSSI